MVLYSSDMWVWRICRNSVIVKFMYTVSLHCGKMKMNIFWGGVST